MALFRRRVNELLRRWDVGVSGVLDHQSANVIGLRYHQPGKLGQRGDGDSDRLIISGRQAASCLLDKKGRLVATGIDTALGALPIIA